MDGVEMIFGALGEGVGFSHQAADPRSQGTKPAFDVVGLAFLFAAATVSSGRESRPVRFPRIAAGGELPEELEAKLVPLPGHTHGHCGVAYREDGKWVLHAGDAYFDSKLNFLDHAPGLNIEISFQTSAADRQASLKKLKALRAAHGMEVRLFCTHDQQEFIAWTDGRGKPDPVSSHLVSGHG